MLKFLIVLAFMFVACDTSKKEIHESLARLGFTEIQVGGQTLINCTDDDKFGRTFTAKDNNRRLISGIVCCHRVSKGCMVSFDP